MFILSGIGAILLFILDVWAIISILGSPNSGGAKIVWIIVVLVLPLVGPLLWMVAGTRRYA